MSSTEQSRQYTSDRPRKRSPLSLKMALHAVIVAIALLILLAHILSFIAYSFNVSFYAGLRSLAAAILPFMAMTYVSLFTSFFQLKQRVPAFNLYFVFSVWTVFLLGFSRMLYGFALPVGELLFSITLAATTWRYGRRSFNAFLSCCYGIVTGALIYVIFADLAFMTP